MGGWRRVGARNVGGQKGGAPKGGGQKGWGPPTQKKWEPEGWGAKSGSRKGGGSKGGGPEGWGGPKFRAFLFLSPPQNSFFSSLSGGLLVDF